MTIETIKILIQFQTELLGTQPNDKDLLQKHYERQLEKLPKEEREEIAKHYFEELERFTPIEAADKATTVFARENGEPVLLDYQIRGFFKEAIKVLAEHYSTEHDIYPPNVAGLVDHTLFVNPRRIRLVLPAGTAMTDLTRSLRSTDQKTGFVRVSLANSEVAPIGTDALFEVQLLQIGEPSKPKVGKDGKTKMRSSKNFLPDDIRAALSYGKLLGLGQWRSGGYGRFEWTEVKSL
jgi:hypothetical protein